jgi:4-alpha-glucanotransferase
MKNRSAGILCPLFSLPGAYGIGQLGIKARKFIDYLSDSGFSFWQILPLNPIDPSNSPYSSSSAFAGYPFYIDLNELIIDGLLDTKELPPAFNSKRVVYNSVENTMITVLKKVYKEFVIRADKSIVIDFEIFKREHNFWLKDFSIFNALKKHFNGRIWNEWPDKFKYHHKLSKKDLYKFEEQIEFEKLLQFLFFRQWHSIKTYASKRGIQIIGDMPIYVNFDSADVWSNPELFKLSNKLKPLEIAGVPPDFFSENGQLWGFPIYNWKNHKNSGFKWWKKRCSHLLKINDIVRFDHFRAVESFWSVSAKEETAKNGRWRKAPGKELLSVLTAIKKDGLIAENLGDLSDEVEALRKQFKIPGMKIFQFAFGGHIHSEHLPHNCAPNDIYYSGTHDNESLNAWLHSIPEGTRNHLLDYFGIKKKSLSIRWIIDRILASSAKTVILPIQDFLEIDNDSRINTPGTVSDSNWSWRLIESYNELIKPSDTQYRLDFFGRKRVNSNKT